jgi:hypothetical protein
MKNLLADSPKLGELILVSERLLSRMRWDFRLGAVADPKSICAEDLHGMVQQFRLSMAVA